MHPFFHIFSFTIPAYGIVILIGCTLGLLLALWRCERKNLSRQHTLHTFLFGVIGLMVGAKLLYIITNIGKIWEYRSVLTEDPAAFFAFIFSGGFVFYGGLIGAIIMVYIYCRAFKIPFLKSMDLFSPTVALAHSVGRIGCFLAGCCYGIHTEGPLGVTFHDSPVAPNGISLFPVQLLESGLNAILCVALLLYARKHRPPGRVIGLYLIIYAVERFCLEFLRFDYIRGFILGVSTSQIISILLLPIGLYLMLRKSREEVSAVDPLETQEVSQ